MLQAGRCGHSKKRRMRGEPGAGRFSAHLEQVVWPAGGNGVKCKPEAFVKDWGAQPALLLARGHITTRSVPQDVKRERIPHSVNQPVFTHPSLPVRLAQQNSMSVN